MIEVNHLYAGYEKDILRDVSFLVQKGEVLGIIGPNGSGKTTLLKALNQTLSKVRGEILIDGRAADALTSKEMAREMAVLPQHHQLSFSFSVEQTVLMGRYPYQKGLFKHWKVEDYNIVDKVMEQTGIKRFRNKLLLSLSGGERQRVFLAQALAQQPQILLLDEPTNHLDFSYQKNMLDALKEMSIQESLTVIAIFHDLNLASLYCDRLLLLEEGRVRAFHTPEKVLEGTKLSEVYQSSINVHAHPYFSKPLTNVVPSYTGNIEKVSVDPNYLDICSDRVYYHSPSPLKCYSSAVLHPGFGWYRHFINLHVDQSFNCENPVAYLEDYADEQGYQTYETLGMMTAAMVEDVCDKVIEGDGFRVLVVVTAGTSNAVDVIHANQHIQQAVPGTINTWIFVDGDLSEQAYVQSVMTATEAKVKAMVELNIRDDVSGTLATGTSTDSTLIGSTQQGKRLEYGGSISPLGRVIGRAVFDTTKLAIERYLKRRGEA
ncbi:adenosylcobinamide amidohydrolase [Halobacillus litoralis]|uniref:ABC transporter ATP-binding protein n=1 Tax=Halobacillus litoralis TaxID=45668 RepID=A0A410MC73_9BACI|nr:adenosylcobinamide amidohydrolase [Halobacillus litoralis]QAS52307.1 ABC transporter ATP-binding protein [Halobacillus litoralis]